MALPFQSIGFGAMGMTAFYGRAMEANAANQLLQGLFATKGILIVDIM